jgi:capsular polysaccharide biosynthesis protein
VTTFTLGLVLGLFVGVIGTVVIALCMAAADGDASIEEELRG